MFVDDSMNVDSLRPKDTNPIKCGSYHRRALYMTKNNHSPLKPCHMLCSHLVQSTCIPRGNYILAHVKMK